MGWDLDDDYEGSPRQRARQRRLAVVAVIVALGMILPVVAGAVSGLAG
ncbi:MAG TPA: hypothetical protein VK007_13040 [Acidimicrobiales bacterium]|nr:hypothetical protein [Acidimicrobiales bacterium]